MTTIQRSFNYYILSLYSQIIPPNEPNANYSRSFGYITCYSEKVAVGYLQFFDREIIPPNVNAGSAPNYTPILNFHISRFNDMMTILHYEKPLVITMDTNTLQGSVTANAYEPVGEQEGI